MRSPVHDLVEIGGAGRYSSAGDCVDCGIALVVDQSAAIRLAWQSAYFLTNERAVLLRKGFFRLHQTEYTADQITDYHIRRRPYDRGDIRLRLSRSAAANPYQDDKMKWLPEKSRTLVSWSGSAPFALYSDGLWGIDTLSGAVAAIDRMKRDALLPRR